MDLSSSSTVGMSRFAKEKSCTCNLLLIWYCQIKLS
jgi:hypothetical protein